MALATLSIDLVAQIAKLEEGLDKAGRLAAKQAQQIERSFGGLKSVAVQLGGVLGGAFSVGALNSYFRATVDGLDRLNDLKDATGASIENISALEDVAARTGTQFESMASSLVKFNAVLNEATPGSEVGNVIKKLGLDVKELRSLDPAEALRQVSQALTTFAEDGDKARVVQTLFGKSVREVAPFLKDLAEQGQLNGTVTKEQAEEAKRFNKQLAELRKNSEDLSRSIVSELLPAANQWLKSLREIGGFKGVFADLLGINEQGRLTAKAEETNAAINRTVESIERMQEALSRKGGKDAFLETRIDKARERLKSLSAQAADTSEKLRSLANKYSPLPESAGAGRGFINPELPLQTIGAVTATKKEKKEKRDFVGPEVPQALKDALQAVEQTDFSAAKRQSDAIEVLVAMFDAGSISAIEYEQALAKLRAGIMVGPLLPPEEVERLQKLNALLQATPSAQLEVTRKEMQLLAAAFERGEITAEQFAEAAQTRLGTLPQNFKPVLDELTEFTREAARNIQDALGDTMLATISGDFQSIGRLWSSLIKRMIAEAAAAKLGKWLLGDFGTSGGSGGGGFLSTALNVIGSLFGGGRASGGPVEAGRIYEVNERRDGPGELLEVGGRQFLMAARSGRVKPGGGVQTSGRAIVLHYSPTVYVDARSDQAQVAALVGGALEKNNEELFAQLEAAGRL